MPADGLDNSMSEEGSVFPHCRHQTCIVHLLRASTAFISHKDRTAVCKGLKPIYQAVDASTAEKALDAFEQSDMGRRYPAIAQTWRRAWLQVVPFCEVSPHWRVGLPPFVVGRNASVRYGQNSALCLHFGEQRRIEPNERT